MLALSPLNLIHNLIRFLKLLFLFIILSLSTLFLQGLEALISFEKPLYLASNDEKENEGGLLHSFDLTKRSWEITNTPYSRPSHIDPELWSQLLPYFLPQDSELRTILDNIFSERRVLASKNSMIKSGFIILNHPKDKTIIAKHPYLKGYLIKAYTDNMQGCDRYWWKKRIDGVKAIQEAIEFYGYQKLMKTPKKWIYPLPAYPAPKENFMVRRDFILIVEEMDILKRKKNLKAYKTQMTTEMLDAFYTMLTNVLLLDSVYPNNTPFCKDGRLAFVDTEHSHDTTRPIPVTIVAQYLSPTMYLYWEQLVINGAPSP